jgi:tungstate transport system substrate-binding protein
MVVRAWIAALVCWFILGAGSVASPEPDFITLASTTSTDNSGLLEHLIPLFRAESGVDVRVVAVGTGQAIRLARAGDADVLLVHDRASEEKFVEAGHGLERVLVMANDFVVVGPSDDPARVRGETDIAVALGRIADANAPFLSRGDDSGTHKAELRLWGAAGVDPGPDSGTWYREAGRGMGATLNSAASMGAYTLSDRGTWLSFGNREGLVIVSEGDPQLENPDGALVVNPQRHPHIKAAQAQAFVAWLVSDAGQRAIADFRVGGEPLFFPRAARP